MKRKILHLAGVVALIAAALPASIAGAAPGDPPVPIPVDISSDLKHRPAPDSTFPRRSSSAVGRIDHSLPVPWGYR